MTEIKSEDILNILKKGNKPGDVAQEIANDLNYFSGLSHYINDEAARKSLQEKILNSTDKEKYIEGLIDIYPFSDRILKGIIVEEKYETINLLEIVQRYECINKSISGLINACSGNDSGISNIEKNLDLLKDEISAKENELNDLNKVANERKDLVKKRDELTKELNEAKRKEAMYSDSEIAKLERQLKDCREKAKKMEEKNKERLENLKKDLEKYSDGGKTGENKAFENALNKFMDVVKKLPKDGTDIDGK